MKFGIYNDFSLAAGNGTNFGVYNNFSESTSTSNKYGVYNYFSMTTAANFYGSYNSVVGAGSGKHYGGYVSLSSVGSGIKYGFSSFISTSAGGQHFGIYSDARKVGAANYAGYFLGNVYVSGIFTNPSDKTLKDNIQNTSSLLEKIKKVEVKDYYFKKDLAEKYGFPRNQQTGFIAQDFETIFPNLVKDEVLHILAESEKKQTEPDRNIKTINYIGMIPLLTKAIQEQQIIIENQAAEIQQIKAMLEKMIQNQAATFKSFNKNEVK